MKRRLATLAVLLAALTAGTTAAAVALPGSNTTTGRWGCVAIQVIDQGVCISNPLPERLPLPSAPTPSVPA